MLLDDHSAIDPVCRRRNRSATAPEPCSDSPGTSTRSTQGQHAFVDEADMDKGATPRPSCFPAHLVKAAPSFLCLRALERDPDVGSSPLQFRLVCQSCEPHEDSASRCLIQSVFTNRCVELVLPGSAKSKNLDETLDTRVMERPHLGWADCSLEDDLNGGGPWTRSGRRDQQVRLPTLKEVFARLLISRLSALFTGRCIKETSEAVVGHCAVIHVRRASITDTLQVPLYMIERHASAVDINPP